MGTQEKQVPTVPGDRLAVIEEFSSGAGTYLNGFEVRAACVGSASYDLRNRRVEVRRAREGVGSPKPGDVVVGLVENVQGGSSNMEIHFINDERSSGRFTAFAWLQRGSKFVVKRGDVMRAQVVSTLNSLIHLSIEGPGLGVIYTACSLCGGPVTPLRGRVKCSQCESVEPRKLASDYGAFQLGRRQPVAGYQPPK